MENQNYNHPSQGLPGSGQAGKEKYDKEEINLKDYLYVANKRKKGIIAIFLIMVIGAVIISLTMPKIFEASALIKVGQKRGEDIESVDKTAIAILSPANLKQIGQRLALGPSESWEGLFTSIALKENEGFLEVSARGSSPGEAVQLVNIVSEMIIGRHQKIGAQAQVTLEEEILQIQDKIKSTELMIEASARTQEDLQVEVQIMKRTVEELIGGSGTISEGRGILFQSYIMAWRDSKDRVENQKTKIEILKAELGSLTASLREKNMQKSYDDQPTSMEAPSVLPQTKIAPQKRKLVMIAGALGLFIGIFWAFSAEYLSRIWNKRG